MATRRCPVCDKRSSTVCEECKLFFQHLASIHYKTSRMMITCEADETHRPLRVEELCEKIGRGERLFEPGTIDVMDKNTM